MFPALIFSVAAIAPIHPVVKWVDQYGPGWIYCKPGESILLSNKGSAVRVHLRPLEDGSGGGLLEVTESDSLDKLVLDFSMGAQVVPLYDLTLRLKGIGIFNPLNDVNQFSIISCDGKGVRRELDLIERGRFRLKNSWPPVVSNTVDLQQAAWWGIVDESEVQPRPGKLERAWVYDPYQSLKNMGAMKFTLTTRITYD